MSDTGEPVQVFVRIRPEFEKKSRDNAVKLDESGSVEQLDDRTVRISPPDGFHGQRKTVSAVDDKTYTYDKIFSPISTQEEMYKVISPLVKDTVSGFNTTVFAYGCTGKVKFLFLTFDR